MTTRRYTAPWGKLLWFFTSTSVFVLGGICVTWFLAPVPGSPIFMLIAAVTLTTCLAFSPRGYQLAGDRLIIERMIGDKSVPLGSLKAVYHEKDLIKGALRVGNGGLFSFAGWYWSARHGWFHLSGTDILGRAVMLELEDEKWMITPGNPQRFVTEASALL